MIVFDLTDHQSFNNCQRWLNELRENAPKNIVILLIGNKLDLQNRQVTRQQIDKFVQKNQLFYMQTSASSGINIQESFQFLTNEMYKIILSKVPQQNSINKKSSVGTSIKEGTIKNVILSNQEEINKKKKKCC